ncbi:MAG: Rieske (2Fe-2S) iron-sulfur domain protein, partial [Actinomycetia bacterium]|nr:Rieske (2Fe-2S) iron-sulfur domain protein [Actinomycetes bacterium]
MSAPPRELDNCDPALRRAWHPVALSDELPEGTVRQVLLLGQLWAIARIDGLVVAFGDRCPHRGAPLSKGAVVGSAIQCRYHGWSFAENGACVRVPALGPGAALPPRAAALVPHGVDERYGIVWLAPETPIAAIVEL